jgi:hypothetical protein
MREIELIEDLSPGAAESVSGIVVLARRVRLVVIAIAVVSAIVLCVAAAAHNF